MAISVPDPRYDVVAALRDAVCRGLPKEEPIDHDPTEALSNRELEIFGMIGQGMTTQQIAHKLELSPRTVETHRKNIKTKLNLANGAQLTRAAFQWGQENG